MGSNVGRGLVGFLFRRSRVARARVLARQSRKTRRSTGLSQGGLLATGIEALGACLGFDFEDRFDLDGRSGGDLGKAQSASRVETVGGFAVDFVQ